MVDCLIRGQKGPGPNNLVCSKFVSGSFKTPEEGHTLSPYVKVTFVGGAEELGVITVGNHSSPTTTPEHVACIKSFEFGYADGLSVRVVIQDQQGGSFHNFMANCIKNYACLDKTAASVEMSFNFGWVKSGCATDFSPSRSPCYFAIIDSIETSYAEGKFTFEITGKDKGFKMFEGGDDRIFGGDGDKAIPITEAITKLLTEGPAPKVKSVQFMTWDNGVKRKAKFLKGDRNGDKEKGPEGKWECKGRDKLQTVIEWLKEHPSEHSRGWVPNYNSLVEGGEMIIWEARIQTCGNQPDGFWDASSLGTYIVNGSKFSPVIEFSPKIRWDFSRLTNMGGAVGINGVNGMKEDGGKNPGDPCATIGRKNNPGGGQTSSTNPSESAVNNAAKGQAEKEVNAAQAAAQKAMRLTTDPITADLTIVGDPEIMPPSDGLYQKNCSIILINPYFIMPTNGACGDWLSQPACNEILSNKAWQIASVTQRIEGGNFTTTLGVFLAAPGMDIDLGANLGGWNGGWTPPPC